jgi:hypothetical protein
VLHTAFWIQHKLFGEAMTGLSPRQHRHALPGGGLLALHAASAGCARCAFFAAALFALHPVQVESVAWITELKNTLSTVFYLSAALLYLRFARTRHWVDYGVRCRGIRLGAVSKTVAGTLPFALLIVVWWQQGRLDVRGTSCLSCRSSPRDRRRAHDRRGGSTNSIARGSPNSNLSFCRTRADAGRALFFHVSKLAWPSQPHILVPALAHRCGAWWQYLYPLGVAARWRWPGSGAADRGRRSRLSCSSASRSGRRSASSISTRSATPSSPTTTNTSPASDF